MVFLYPSPLPENQYSKSSPPHTSPRGTGSGQIEIVSGGDCAQEYLAVFRSASQGWKPRGAGPSVWKPGVRAKPGCVKPVNEFI